MKFGLLIIVGLTLFSYGETARAETAKIVCFGDSITNRGFFKVLEDLLDVESVNAGKGGHSSAMGLRRMPKDVIAQNPDVVVIMFGTNDLRADSERVFVPVAKYKANLEKMIASCREHGSKVVLCTLPPINEEKFFTRHERAPFAALGGLPAVVQSYANAARDVATEHKVRLVDLNQLLAKQPQWISPDGVHPSKTGTKLIAQHVGEAVHEVVGAEVQSSTPKPSSGEINGHDVVIYGGTAAAVVAAVQTHRMGKSVVIVAPGKHLGGLSSGGLGFTDIGNRLTVGGLAREFYEKVYQHYDKPAAWTKETPEEFHRKKIGWRKMWAGEDTRWVFEPHVAEAIFDQLVADKSIPLFRDEWLDREHGVKKDAARIESITTLSGKVFTGKVFIDATYEGDLMAAAGVSYHVGREANSVYGEKWNGVQQDVFHHKHHFEGLKISPYKVKGDPSSGVLARISTEKLEANGTGDNKVQAYCFRMCLTNEPENRIPFPKPRKYDPEQYELLLRIFEVMDPMYVFQKFDPVPNNKTDTNNHGPFSFDNLGMNYDYPEASYERRKEIIEEHKAYQLGMLYFICHDPRVPKQLQEAMREWGLPKDEFADNDNWSHQLYIREARRMVGKYVVTERDLLGELKSKTKRSIGMGSYGIDSHNIQRFVTTDGYVQNEGDVGVHVGAYRIPYDVIVPKEEEVSNLIVPVAASCSHVAYGSIRMEPVFMILGQGAATAACIAMDDQTSVQSVDYKKLRTRLLADEQILDKSQGLPDPRKKK